MTLGHFGVSTDMRSKSHKLVLITGMLAGHSIDSWEPLIQVALEEVCIYYIC